MTQIITRYFESAETARDVAQELKQRHRFPPRIVSTYTSADGLAAKLAEDSVKKKTAKAYADRLSDGGGVVLIRAGYKPLGVARIAREVMAERGAVDMGATTEEVTVKDAPSRGESILSSHPLLMTVPRRKGSKTVHMAEWPIPLIIRRKPMDRSLSVRIGTITGRFMPLLSRRKPADRFAFRRHARMAAFPIGLLVPGHKYMAKFPFGHIVPGHKYMANFPFGHIIPGHKLQAGFPFGHLVPGGRRMANWPFPLLIDGEPGPRTVLKDAPHIAGSKDSLLSDREPADKFAFPRHARMANWPIPLISRRSSPSKTASNHKHVAEIGLPLVLSERREGPEGKGKRFTFSGMLGWKTLTERKAA